MAAALRGALRRLSQRAGADAHPTAPSWCAARDRSARSSACPWTTFEKLSKTHRRLHPAGPAGRGQDDRSAAHRAGQGLRPHLQEEDGARIPLFVRLSAQQVDESPRDFLARMWREAMPGGQVDAASEVREAAASGPALHPVRRPQRGAARRSTADRMHDWRRFAAKSAGGQPADLLLSHAGLRAANWRSAGGDRSAGRRSRFRSLPSAIWTTNKGAAVLAGAATSSTATCWNWPQIPYYLHMLVEVFDEQGDLPPHRAQLFEQFVHQLFAREQGKRHAVAWIEPARPASGA